MYELDNYCEKLLIKHNPRKYNNSISSDISSLIKKEFGFEIRYIKEEPENCICGYTVYSDKPDCPGTVFINSNIKNHEIINFTLAHECGHIIMRKVFSSGSYPLIYGSYKKLERDLEAASNQLASALIMPKNKFIKEYVKLFGLRKLQLYEHRICYQSDRDKIFALKNSFECSETALLIRMSYLNLTENLSLSEFNLMKGFSYHIGI